MKKRLLIITILFSIYGIRGAAELSVQSSAISYPGGPIEKEYTCDGKNISPQVGWTAGPLDTKSYVLICEDPDAPRGTWVHWVVYDIPASVKLILDNQPVDQIGAKMGVNSWGKKNYSGPCPPKGTDHQYYFKVWAADIPQLDIQGTATKDAIMQALVNHTTAEGYMMGHYERQK